MDRPVDPVAAAPVGVAIEPGCVYPASPPFHPSEVWPEYPFGAHCASEPNAAYRLVRQAFVHMGLDAAHFGSPQWNPLGAAISSGDTVLIKPNMVMDAHPLGLDLNALITHGSVVRAILDYVHIALGGRGRVFIADAPIQTTRFEVVAERSGTQAVVDWYRAETPLDVRLVDLRQVVAFKDERGHVARWQEVARDPNGYVTFDLGDESLLAPVAGDGGSFRVSNYRSADTRQYHGPHSHRYVVGGSVIAADAIISVPKMKTHSKVGVTLGLKNLVGTVGRKQCLAHHRAGGAAGGGDEYPGRSLLKAVSSRLEEAIDGNPHRAIRELLKLAYRVSERLLRMSGADPLRDGAWHGNDTVWRMTLDLVRIAMYGRRDGTLADVPQRSVITVIDGITAGEGEGPLAAIPRPAGAVVGSMNPVAADAVTAALMGFDWRKIPLLKNAFESRPHPLCTRPAAELSANVNGELLGLPDLLHSPRRMKFEPSAGWKGHIEMDQY